MSLQKKIILSFLVSAFIIALLSAFLYINFVEIKKETAFLESTDTIRSKSLQLRRHEKNFFLYAPAKAGDESKAIYQYLKELDEILGSLKVTKIDRTASLDNLIKEYRRQFGNLERLVRTVSAESERLKKSSAPYSKISRLIESNFLDKPLEDVNYLQEVYFLPSDHELISSLKELDSEINALRKTGENILTSSKELDKTAREKVDDFIRISRIAILIFFPLFLVVGFGAILFIVSNVVRRLHSLSDLADKIGHGNFSYVPEDADSWGKDEVGSLMRKFIYMEEQLALREKELLRTKKLAAIGTLASGVAHELNNPLNNIYLSAQVLQKEAGEKCSPFVKETLDDIIGQSVRVKGIVGDLLEYARGRELRPRTIELNELIRNAYKLLKTAVNKDQVNLVLNSRDRVFMLADQEQLERVFINLFTNAVEAMGGKGDIIVTLSKEQNRIKVWVSDTGKGMTPEEMEKVFEPFFTTKDKGTGLGLAIVFNIVKKHSGEILVDSEKDKGTTFYMAFPGGEDGA
jgi:two-component system, NtrC family, sensor kinase